MGVGVGVGVELGVGGSVGAGLALPSAGGEDVKLPPPTVRAVPLPAPVIRGLPAAVEVELPEGAPRVAPTAPAAREPVRVSRACSDLGTPLAPATRPEAAVSPMAARRTATPRARDGCKTARQRIGLLHRAPWVGRRDSVGKPVGGPADWCYQPRGFAPPPRSGFALDDTPMLSARRMGSADIGVTWW